MAIRLDGSSWLSGLLPASITLSGTEPWAIGQWMKYDTDPVGSLFGLLRVGKSSYYVFLRGKPSGDFFAYTVAGGVSKNGSLSASIGTGWFFVTITREIKNGPILFKVAPENGEIETATLSQTADITIDRMNFGSLLGEKSTTALEGALAEAFLMTGQGLSNTDVAALVSGSRLSDLYTPQYYYPLDTVADLGSHGTESVSLTMDGTGTPATVEGPGVLIPPEDPPAFSGPIPDQLSGQGAVLSLDMSGYFSGVISSFSASGLPDGAVMNASSGVIEGELTATAATNSPYESCTVTATNASGNTVSNTFKWTVSANRLFTVTLSKPTGGATLGGNSQATVEITS